MIQMKRHCRNEQQLLLIIVLVSVHNVSPQASQAAPIAGHILEDEILFVKSAGHLDGRMIERFGAIEAGVG